MTIHNMARPTRSVRSTGWVPFALIALVLIPAAAGSLRLIELAGGPLVIPENARMTASPVPVVVHIASTIPGTGELAYLFRLAFGSGIAASIILGFKAIRHADVTRHRAWMTRAYALALGAGTQVFTQGIGNAVFGVSELTTDLMLGAGWALNLIAAEFIIRSGGNQTDRTTGEARLS